MRAFWSFNGVGFSYEYDAMGETLTLSVKKGNLSLQIKRDVVVSFSFVLEKNN